MSFNFLYDNIGNQKYQKGLIVLEVDSSNKCNNANSMLYTKLLLEYIDFNKISNTFYKIKQLDRYDDYEVIAVKLPEVYEEDKIRQLYIDIYEYAVLHHYNTVNMTVLWGCAHRFNNLLDSKEIGKNCYKDYSENFDLNLLYYNVKSNDHYQPKNYIDNYKNEPYINTGLFNKSNLNSFMVINKVENKTYNDKTEDYINFNNLYDENEAFKPDVSPTDAYDFLREYCSKVLHKDLKDSLHIFVNKSKIAKAQNGRNKIQKKDILRVALGLHLNRSDFIHLLILSGFALSPSDKLDVWIYHQYTDNYDPKEFENQKYFSITESRIYTEYYDSIGVIHNLFD